MGGSTALPGDWFDSAWAQRRKVTVTDPQLTEQLQQFQVPVRLDAQSFDYASAQPNGEDLRFVDDHVELREIAPSSLLFPSRIWEGLARTMQMRVDDSFSLNRALFKLFLPVAYKVIDLEDQRKPIPPHLRFLRWVGNMAVLGPLRDKIGTLFLQLPPRFTAEQLPRLQTFLDALPRDYHYAVELRDPAMFGPPTFDVLKNTGSKF